MPGIGCLRRSARWASVRTLYLSTLFLSSWPVSWSCVMRHASCPHARISSAVPRRQPLPHLPPLPDSSAFTGALSERERGGDPGRGRARAPPEQKEGVADGGWRMAVLLSSRDRRISPLSHSASSGPPPSHRPCSSPASTSLSRRHRACLSLPPLHPFLSLPLSLSLSSSERRMGVWGAGDNPTSPDGVTAAQSTIHFSVLIVLELMRFRPPKRDSDRLSDPWKDIP